MDRKPAPQYVPDGQCHFLRGIPVDADEFVRVQGKVLLINAAGAASFPAGEYFLLLFLHIPYRDSHSGIGDRVRVKKQGKPGKALLVSGKVQAPRKTGGHMSAVFFHFVTPGTFFQGKCGP
jgi:hypothetical protein